MSRKTALNPTPANAVKSLLALAATSIEHFVAAENVGESSDAAAMLLAHAEGHLHVLVNSIKRHPLTNVMARAWLLDLAEIQAFTEGAIGLDKLKPRASVASAALEALQAMTLTLKAPGWPEEMHETYQARCFMAGKALAADMIADAIALQDKDTGELFAKYRGCGVDQDLFATEYVVLAAQEDREVMDGFCAALNGALVAAGSALADPDEIRDASYEDCIGGPSVKYMAEEQDARAETAEPQRLEIILDTLDEHLTAASAVRLPPDCLKLMAEAVKASALARLASGTLEVETHLQQVRRYVYEARTDYRMVVNFAKGDPLALALREMLAAHRLLNKCLGGVMIEDRGNEPRGSLGQLLDRLDHYLDGTEHVVLGDATGDAVFGLMHSEVHALYFDAEEAEARGDEAEALRLLPELRASVAKAFAACDVNDGRWALLKVSLDVLNEFLRNEPGSSPRMETARQASTFIARIATHYRDGGEGSGYAVEQEDLEAIGQAAGVILSAIDDDVAADAELERQLEAALELATVYMTAQPPKSSGLPKIIEGPVIDKKTLAGALTTDH